MIEQVFGCDRLVAEFVAGLIPGLGSAEDFGSHAAIGFALDGRLIAGAVYHEYRKLAHGADIRLAFGATNPRWGTKRNIRAVFAFPFLQCDCARVTTVAGRRNEAARRLNERVGFKFEGLVRHAWDGREDAVLYGMLREECRWLNEGRDGQEVELAAAGA